MTGPGGKRRRWLVGLVVAWIVVVVGLGVWSVGHQAATVPEQRSIAVAVPELQQAAGVLFAAADGDGRALALGELELIDGCRITPLRDGVEAARDLTVYVAPGQARTAFDRIVAGLPPGYRAGVIATRGGTRLGFHADAGNFIGIDSTAESSAKVFTLRLTSGCRPDSGNTAGETDPSPGPPPAAYDAVMRALGGAATPETTAVTLPGNRTGASWSAELDEPADLAQRLRQVSLGATIVRDDAGAWVYRTADSSVVVVPDGKRVKLTVSGQ